MKNFIIGATFGLCLLNYIMLLVILQRLTK